MTDNPSPAPVPPAIARRADIMAQRLRDHHRTGTESRQSSLTGVAFAEQRQLNPNFVSKARVFAKQYSAEDLHRLCGLRRRDGLALNFAHVNILTIVPEADRPDFERLIAVNSWSAPRAHAEVKRQYSREAWRRGGRPLKKAPADAREHLEQAVEAAAGWLKRYGTLSARLANSRPQPNRSAKKKSIEMLADLEAAVRRLKRSLGK